MGFHRGLGLATTSFIVSLAASAVSPGFAWAEEPPCADPKFVEFTEHVRNRLEFIQKASTSLANSLAQSSHELANLDKYAKACMLSQTSALSLAIGSVLAIPAAIVAPAAGAAGAGAAATTTIASSAAIGQLIVTARSAVGSAIGVWSTLAAVDQQSVHDYSRTPPDGNIVLEDLNNYKEAYAVGKQNLMKKYAEESQRELDQILSEYADLEVGVLREWGVDNKHLEDTVAGKFRWSPLYNPWKNDASLLRLQTGMIRAEMLLYTHEAGYLLDVYDRIIKTCEFQKDLQAKNKVAPGNRIPSSSK